MTSDKPDYEDAHKALDLVSKATDKVNQLMAQQETFKKLLELQERFENLNDLIKPGRFLVKEGMVLKQSRKRDEPRHLTLLNDSIIIGKKLYLPSYIAISAFTSILGVVASFCIST